jgi:hypothetical protein
MGPLLMPNTLGGAWGVRVFEEPWSVLLEHQIQTSDGSLDGETILMLGLEQLLVDERIDVAFDPFRPGEGHAGVYGCTIPLRMLVRTADLSRARRLLEEFRSAPVEIEGFDDEPEDDPEADCEPASASASEPDSFDGWWPVRK